MLIDDPILNARTAYERQFAGQIGAKHAIAFAYARTGLRAILSALGTRPGDEIILSPLTCKVVPLTVLSLNLKPVYADIRPETLNLDPHTVRQSIGSSTRAILFQHTYGNAGGLEEAARIAADRRVPLIEDRAQCLPSSVPLAGTAAVYSNNLLKPLPAGSGGVVVTNDTALAESLSRTAASLPSPGLSARIRQHAEGWVHRHVLRPELYWLALHWSGSLDPECKPLDQEIATEISACMQIPSMEQMRDGARALTGVDRWERHRRECCLHYHDLLAGSIEIPPMDFRQPLFYFPVRTTHKAAVLEEAARRRVELIPWPNTTPIYPIQNEALKAYGFDPAVCPVASRLAGELIGLPTHDKITGRHRRRIATLLRSFHG